MPRVPKYKPPPIPMPHAERTIYVHVKNEKPEVRPENDKLIEISGKRVLVSALAQKEIENATKNDPDETLKTNETLNAQVNWNPPFYL